jgi:ribonuclease R
MSDKIGEEFAGVVTGVVEFGLFVQLEGMQVDGLVHVSTLGHDYFRFEEDRRALVGERSGTRYTLGDKLRVRLTRVDASERKMDFELVEKTESAFHPRARGKDGGHGSTATLPRGAREPRGPRPSGGKRKKAR